MITHCLLIFRRSVAICVADAFLSFFGLLSICIHLHVAKLLHFALVFLSFFAVVLSLSFPCHILFEPASLSFYLEIRGDREDGKRVFACKLFSSFFEFAAVRIMGFFWRSPAVEATLHKKVSFVSAFFLRCFFFLCSFLLFEQEGFVSNGGGGWRVYGRHFFLFIFNVRFHCLFVCLCARSFGLCFFLASFLKRNFVLDSLGMLLLTIFLRFPVWFVLFVVTALLFVYRRSVTFYVSVFLVPLRWALFYAFLVVSRFLLLFSRLKCACDSRLDY